MSIQTTATGLKVRLILDATDAEELASTIGRFFRRVREAQDKYPDLNLNDRQAAYETGDPIAALAANMIHGGIRVMGMDDLEIFIVGDKATPTGMHF